MALSKRSRQQVWRRDMSIFQSSGVNAFAPSVRIAVLRGLQYTESEGHPFHGKYSGNDDGGNFYTEQRRFGDKRHLATDPQPQHTLRKTITGSDGRVRVENYFGGLYVKPGDQYLSTIFSTPLPGGVSYLSDQVYPAVSKLTDPEMDAWGAKAVSLVKPGDLKVGITTAIAEIIREGIPHMVGAETLRERTLRAKQAGSEYLNVQFGWLPLVSDTLKVADTVRNYDARVQQLLDNEGKLLRRRFQFDPMITTTTEYENLDADSRFITTPVSSASRTFSDFNGGAKWRKIDTLITKREIWFSGAFKYYLGDNFHSSNQMVRSAARIKEVFGLDLNPDVLWNLTPWSWAADWFGNFGDVVSNVNSFANDGLVMPFGYIMCRTTLTRECTMIRLTDPVSTPGRGGTVFGDLPDVVSTTYKTVVKQRRRANPFGFGLTYAGLSGKQKSILAAIGMTRLL